MKSYIGHHTCKNEGGYNFVLKEAPFLSKWPTEELDPEEIDRRPFLGEGYYFWEFDVKQAKWWGSRFYDNQYYIFQASINTTNENFMDLVGDVQKQGELMLTLTKLIARNE